MRHIHVMCVMLHVIHIHGPQIQVGVESKMNVFVSFKVFCLIFIVLIINLYVCLLNVIQNIATLKDTAFLMVKEITQMHVCIVMYHIVETHGPQLQVMYQYLQSYSLILREMYHGPYIVVLNFKVLFNW
jgi:hypothetical protein